ncbi:MAG: hypothetical protein V4792_09310 [Pseudomonadota bacterium]
MNDTITKDELPTSFTAFNPIGHLMLGLPSTEQVASLTAALRLNGWPDDALVNFTPREGVEEFAELIDKAGPLVGFGYEITLARRYLKLSRQGYRWLLVKVEDSEAASRAAEIAREHGATLAVHYRLLIAEELI